MQDCIQNIVCGVEFLHGSKAKCSELTTRRGSSPPSKNAGRITADRAHGSDLDFRVNVQDFRVHEGLKSKTTLFALSAE